MNASDAHQIEVENDRLQFAAEMAANEGDDWADAYRPGSLGCHELLDRTAMLAAMLDEHILTHPACVVNRDWYALAEHAATTLNELYQEVGAAHLDEEER